MAEGSDCDVCEGFNGGTKEEKEVALPEEDSVNDMKKKRLLEELESVLMPKDRDTQPSLGIEVIDETALVETFPPNPKKAPPTSKKSRKRTKKDAARHKKAVTVTVTVPEDTRKYSRKQMESLRFVNMKDQRKFWKTVYGALEATVAKEYDTLSPTFNSDPRQCLPNKKPPPPILSVGAANGRWRYVNVFVH